ncbi:TPM domain-containing protein [Bartonella sp. HY761]|uniref:TPM domain-containing protein n=1 Tax=Bartonella sp. HY761 TaxID=2979330 RepID=UPI0022092FC9|nr:TPM domain-containing protein [Bartonella sp. HY761]UXN05470.1 TPM domain-containing protein [Bartonella sp. HY761]
MIKSLFYALVAPSIMVVRAFIWTLLVYLSCLSLSAYNAVFAQTNFPQLSDRIVDNAHLLNQDTINQLSRLLVQQEQKSGDQIVIATLPNLDGRDIESYSNALFRYWKLGQKDQNNGVLFLIAPNDRAVRIEVGYGLEGVLTDAAASVIINTIVLPKFRANNYQQGIIDGTTAIITVINGEESELLSRIRENEARIKNEKSIEARNNFIIITIIALCFLVFIVLPMLASIFGTQVGPKRYRWLGIVFFLWYQGLLEGGGPGNGRGPGGFGGGGFGGGRGESRGGRFRGGGGSSGGGGASGRW